MIISLSLLLKKGKEWIVFDDNYNGSQSDCKEKYFFGIVWNFKCFNRQIFVLNYGMIT